MKNKMTFALYFGNRGFFPEALIAKAREELKKAVSAAGYGCLLLEAEATRYGAVETAVEGRKYAAFLKANEGRFDGAILCLPNFGDETGAVEAFRDAGVPIMINAYPDELDKMGFSCRRDAFCGKFSVMDMFCQYRIPFTALPPHTAHPLSKTFAGQLELFAATCRVVKGMKRFTIGALGARTTAFKTVRFDEVALQKNGITVEALDLSEVFMRLKSAVKGKAYNEKAGFLRGYADFSRVPADRFETIVKLSVVIDEIIAEYGLDAIALRCWLELEKEFKIAPCVLLSELNNRGIAAACELDVGNAVMMHALKLASEKPATCLDWNNNYGEEEDKCILFHCGPVPADYMKAKGRVTDHPMFSKALGKGSGWGPSEGRIKKMPFTFASSNTENGKLVYYLGEGEFTNDPIANDFFGCAGVAKIANLQEKLITIGKKGFRHHVSVAGGHVAGAVKEAFSTYLNYEQVDL